MTALRIAAALLLPVAVALAYAPLHKGWLVQMIGCACAGATGFNASTLSLFIHCIAALYAAVLLWRAARRLPLKPRTNAIALGLIYLGATTFYYWQHDCSL